MHCNFIIKLIESFPMVREFVTAINYKKTVCYIYILLIGTGRVLLTLFLIINNIF